MTAQAPASQTPVSPQALRVTVLGCGSAPGVPSLSKGWGQCDPGQPRNRRSRASILVAPSSHRGRAEPSQAASAAPILVDTTPDLRAQLLAAEVSRLSAVLYTHDHADHLHGLDDLREINRAMNAPLDIHADATTLARIEEAFGYALTPMPEGARSIFKPLLVPRVIDGPFDVAGIPIMPFRQDHGIMSTLGFRFGDAVAYSTDVVNLDEAAFDILAGVHTWIVGCLGWTAHPTHAHVGKVLKWAERVGPARLILTHLGLGLDYDTLCGALPEGAEPAYDGMEVVAPMNGQSVHVPDGIY